MLIDLPNNSVISSLNALKGDDYLKKIITFAATQTAADIIFIAKIDKDKQQAETLYVLKQQQTQDNFQYALQGTPCEKLNHQETCIITKGLKEQFPKDQLLIDMGISSYIGMALYDSKKQLIGLLTALYYHEIEQPSDVIKIFEIISLASADALEKHLLDIDLKHQQQAVQSFSSQLSIAENIYNYSSDGIIITDANNQIIYTNPALERMSGYHEHELLGQNPRLLNSGEMPKKFYENMWGSIIENGHWQGEITNRKKSTQKYTVYTAISTIADQQGRPVNHIAIHRDISGVKKARELIAYQASHDKLTGLFNRYEFNAQLETSLNIAQKTLRTGYFILIDIDNFKSINDTHGHSIGDEYIKTVAQYIKNSFSKTQLIARLDGDEFGLFLFDHDQEEILLKINSLKALLSKPTKLTQGVAIQTTISIGLSKFPTHSNNAQTLYSYADQALNLAKQSGKNTYYVFNEAIKAKLDRDEAIKSNLIAAIELKQIKAYFQPILEINSKKVSHVEVLARWHDPDLGQVFPDEFIPIAEKNHLISALGNCVLEDALHKIERINKTQNSHLSIAVNRSAQELMQDDSLFHETIKKTGIDPSRITIELTESLMIDEPQIAKVKLQALRNHGYQLAMDDFGTGYSSLSYLKHFPFNYLKIDKSFTMELKKNNQDYKLIKTIINMAENFGLKTIAEGVETAEQFKILRELGCDYVQGYYFSRPLPVEELIVYLKEINNIDPCIKAVNLVN